MKSVLLAEPDVPEASNDLAWRVLALVNLFRLLVPLLLAGLYFTITPPPVGQAHPALFAGAIGGYFGYAILSIGSVKRRWPDLALLAFVNVCADVIAIALFTYSS